MRPFRQVVEGEYIKLSDVFNFLYFSLKILTICKKSERLLRIVFFLASYLLSEIALYYYSSISLIRLIKVTIRHE